MFLTAAPPRLSTAEQSVMSYYYAWVLSAILPPHPVEYRSIITITMTRIISNISSCDLCIYLCI